MELFYNPHAMPEDEIKKTFVARQHLLDELVSLIEHQPDGAGVQHVIIIAPRGMGKTTMLLMVQFAVRDRCLSSKWQTVQFPEESYSINDLADFWTEVIDHLAFDTNDAALRGKVAELRVEYGDSDDLQEAALAVIKDWSRKRGKRMLLLIDNLDMIFEQINDTRDNARLREVLMNDGTMMILGGATTFFREVRDYDQPLYNFFKIYNLDGLRFEQMTQLLRQRAELDLRENFEETLKANTARLRVLEHFTGGNPRFLLMLYRVATQSDISQARRGLEKLLDEVTPYFKAKTESLPAQQRKILDFIARESSRTQEGVTPGAVAQATRMTTNQASAQLKRLTELGYVQAANLRSRSSYYTLSEPLYAIWYKMRMGRDARQRMEWLVDFLKQWYEAEEMKTESGRLDGLFREHLSAGRLVEAGKTLEFRHCLALAMGEEILTPNLLASLPLETRNYLRQAGWISEDMVIQAKASALLSVEAQRKAELTAIIEQIISAVEEGRFDEILQQVDGSLEIAPHLQFGWFLRGYALYELNRYEEAIASIDRGLGIELNDPEAWHLRGVALSELGKYEEAIESFDRALEIKPDDHEVWVNRGNVLDELGRHQEAVESYGRALEIEPDDHQAWNNRGIALGKLGRYEEAIENFNRILQIKPGSHLAWYNHGTALFKLNRYEEAIASYDRALKINPTHHEALHYRSVAYLIKFLLSISEDDENTARQDWNEGRKSSEYLEKKDQHNMAAVVLQTTAEAGHLKLARQLISESDLEEPLFPLARAIDYLLIGDEALIEKLSPEVRGIVEEIVDKLGKSSGKTPRAQATARKKKTTKKKSGPRSRVRKQLA